MPSAIQIACATEACFNTPAIIALTFFPAQTLSYFRVAPASPILASDDLTNLLARLTGILIAALTPQLLIAYPNGSSSGVLRRMAYLTLGTGEVLMIPLLFWEAFRATDSEKKLGLGGGFTRSAAVMSAISLVGTLAWRFYVWKWKPEWFDAGSEESVTKKGSILDPKKEL